MKEGIYALKEGRCMQLKKREDMHAVEEEKGCGKVW